ncbi:MAG: cupredoxin family copper-binding protein [Candidatus Eremiobacteraeota bacterium]|nr:cupredoxin family copper-binding protein [Candidatus Eremiobacteraeota bacterium]
MRSMSARAALAGASLVVALSLGAGAVAISTASADSASNGEVHVSIDNYAFKAPQVTIPGGEAVVWTNKDDDPHTVTADDGSFDSKGLAQGDTFRHVFSKPGTYPYHCSAHPYMKGTVIVQGGK